MVELVYTSDLKSDAARIMGSSPITRIVRKITKGGSVR